MAGCGFVSMYVNERTLDYGADGREAIRKLLDMGFERGIIPVAPKVEFVDCEHPAHIAHDSLNISSDRPCPVSNVWRGLVTFDFSNPRKGHSTRLMIFPLLPKFFLISADASQQEMFQDATTHTPKDSSRIA